MRDTAIARGSTMFLFLLIPVLLLLGALIVFGLPLLPLIVLGALGLAIYRFTSHHHHHTGHGLPG